MDSVRTGWMIAAGAASATALALVVQWALGPPMERLLPADRPNVVLVLVDTLRADRLGAYGGDRPDISPRLDALAADAVLFERAVSPDASTLPSVASLFTGLHPEAHQVRRARGEERVAMHALAPELDTLAERLQGAGYHTAALLKTEALSSDDGFSQGFDTWRVVRGDGASGRSGAELTDAAIEWLRHRSAAPFFLYLHYMDPHTPYQAPETWGYTDPAYAGHVDGTHSGIRRFTTGEATPTAADADHLRALYDAEIRYLDGQLGRLFDHLSAARLLEHTVVVVTADHGEQLGEHGGWLNEHLYQENVHVPLLIRAPGQPPARIPGQVSTMDIGATLLELIDEPHEGFGQAESLLPLRAEPRAPGRHVFAHVAEHHATYDGPLKLIVGDGADRLYDLELDPHELDDLAPRRPLDVDRLRARIERHVAASRALQVGAGRPGADP